MKRTLITITALFTLCSFAVAEDPSEIARQRNEQIARDAANLKDLDTQITGFESDLAKEEKTSLDLQATQTTLATEGKQLVSDAHDMMAQDKAYGTEVKQQIAECPASTTDATLAERCHTWKGRLDKKQSNLRLLRKNFTDRKNKFLIAKNKLDQDMAANNKALEHFRYSIPKMKIQRDRILEGLWKINLDVKNCRAAIEGSSEEHMHAVCGQMWDGNKAYPQFSPEPVDGKKP